MTEETSPGAELESMSPEETRSALFAHLIVQQSNMALMLLGKMPHPETGEVVKNIEGAKLFIDLLEMLEAKTAGNLSRQEERLLKQTLMQLRMSFVEAVESPGAQEAPAAASQAGSGPAPKEPTTGSPEAEAAAEEHRKKFSKKY